MKLYKHYLNKNINFSKRKHYLNNILNFANIKKYFVKQLFDELKNIFAVNELNKILQSKYQIDFQFLFYNIIA